MRYFIETAWDGRHPHAKDSDALPLFLEVSKEIFSRMKDRIAALEEPGAFQQFGDKMMFATAETAHKLETDPVMVVHVVEQAASIPD